MAIKKILLINPSENTDISQTKIFRVPPLNLGILAALTPDKYEVKIIDENITQCQENEAADLVGITAMTPQANRAYALCNRFRSRGVPVIMGGIHASMVTDEAIQHADAVVTGEAEEIWVQVLKDAKNNCLKQIYRGGFADLSKSPAPRRDLLDSKAYFVDTLQTTRGCPNNCRFCSVTRFNGSKYRFRPIKDVIEDIEQTIKKNLFIVDDNIVGVGEKSIQRAKDLFAAMEGCRKNWGAQTCIDIVERQDVLKAARKSGASYLFIGFESIGEKSLKGMNKNINLRPGSRDYTESIKILHDHGFLVIGGFIFGLDSDTKESFERTLAFVEKSKLDVAQFTVQTPLPGTRQYQEFKQENRLLYTNYPQDWRKYCLLDIVMEPKNMTREELKEGYLNTLKTVSSLKYSLTSAAKSLFSGKGYMNAITTFYWHYNHYKRIKRNIETC